MSEDSIHLAFQSILQVLWGSSSLEKSRINNGKVAQFLQLSATLDFSCLGSRDKQNEVGNCCYPYWITYQTGIRYVSLDSSIRDLISS